MQQKKTTFPHIKEFVLNTLQSTESLGIGKGQIRVSNRHSVARNCEKGSY